MTTPTPPAERLAEMERNLRSGGIICRAAGMRAYRILTRLAATDGSVIEAAALTRCAMPDQVNVCETACAACVDEARAALSAAVATAMQMEGKDG